MPEPAGHPSSRLNRVLDDADFDTFVEAQCTKFYAEGLGRPSVTPGRYFRLLLLGYFEGLDSERAIADDETATQTFGLGSGHLTPHPEGTCAQEAMVYVRRARATVSLGTRTRTESLPGRSTSAASCSPPLAKNALVPRLG